MELLPTTNLMNRIGRSCQGQKLAGTPALLSANEVRIEYDLRNENATAVAVANFTLTVVAGEFISIVGPSGCGKSTVLRAIGGLIDPSSGSIEIDGQPVEGPGFDRATVFQNASLLPWRTATRNVSFGLELKGVSKREATAQARRYIEIVGLSSFANRYPRQLSGGMQQRVNLARALAVEPRLLLLDEPFASLDAQTREEMQVELLRISGKLEQTCIFVTHQVDEAVFLADTVVVMTGGPGSVIAEQIPVSLPRPRSDATRQNEKYSEIVAQVRHVLASRRTPEF